MMDANTVRVNMSEQDALHSGGDVKIPRPSDCDHPHVAEHSDGQKQCRVCHTIIPEEADHAE